VRAHTKAIYVNGINSQDLALWRVALIVTEAMEPGFEDWYIRRKIEEREQAE
jgi:hypothetical protein